MKRRRFSGLLAGAAVASALPARGQQPAMPVIGFLHASSSEVTARFVAGFRNGLAEAGYVESRNVAIIQLFAGGRYDRLPALAADLVVRKVDVIFTGGGFESARAAKAATTTIPIVFQMGADPVATGVVASLNRPGGNVTGVSLLNSVLEAKRVELVHEAAPKASTIANLINPTYPQAKAQSADIQKAAALLGVTPVILTASTPDEIDAAFTLLDRRAAGALTVGSDPILTSHRDRIVALAARRALPAIYPIRDYVLAGGLMSYGTDFAVGYHQAGLYVGKVLKGAKPTDLPVLQPTSFELVTNLKTARAQGITIPPSILARADEVLE